MLLNFEYCFVKAVLKLHKLLCKHTYEQSFLFQLLYYTLCDLIILISSFKVRKASSHFVCLAIQVQGTIL